MQMEVAYRFLVGFVDSAGNYCDSLAAVAVLQLSSPSLFWFNLVTSVPVAWIEWATVQVTLPVCTAETFHSSAMP
jgi:hypothetical protein